SVAKVSCQPTPACGLIPFASLRRGRPGRRANRVPTMHYLVAYDITDPRRLQRVARFLEKRALRCQKSVFLFAGDAAQLAALLAGRYQPAAPRWVEIPKSDPAKGTRRLGILTIADRIVHAALKQILEPILEPLFLPTSFGFRPGRSVAGALDEAARLLSVD